MTLADSRQVRGGPTLAHTTLPPRPHTDWHSSINPPSSQGHPCHGTALCNPNSHLNAMEHGCRHHAMCHTCSSYADVVEAWVTPAVSTDPPTHLCLRPALSPCLFQQHRELLAAVGQDTVAVRQACTRLHLGHVGRQTPQQSLESEVYRNPHAG